MNHYKKYISRSQTWNRHNSPFKTLLGLIPLLSDCNKNFPVLQFKINGSTEKIWSIWGHQSRSLEDTLESPHLHFVVNVAWLYSVPILLEWSPQMDQIFSVLPLASNWSNEKFFSQLDKSGVNPSNVLNDELCRFKVWLAYHKELRSSQGIVIPTSTSNKFTSDAGQHFSDKFTSSTQ